MRRGVGVEEVNALEDVDVRLEAAVFGSVESELV